MMTQLYAIFDRGPALLQFAAEADSPIEALEAFHAVANIDETGEGLDVDDWHIIPVTSAEMMALDAWAAAGSSDECPVEIGA